MKKYFEGELAVSFKAFKAIIKKYNLHGDENGNLPLEPWMVEEMEAWDRANNTGPDKVKVKPN